MAAKLRKSWLERRGGIERRVAVGSVDGVRWRAERAGGGWAVRAANGGGLDPLRMVKVYAVLGSASVEE
jgi:hypothetical protein